MVQVVFSEKFTRFITWPDDSKVNDTLLPFTICIVGKTEASIYFEQLFTGTQKKIKGKEVDVIHLNEEDEVPVCDMIYIATNDIDRLKEIENIVEDKPILTISEAGVSESNAVIMFFYLDNNILFDIDSKAVKKQHLKVSHLLLKLSKQR